MIYEALLYEWRNPAPQSIDICVTNQFGWSLRSAKEKTKIPESGKLLYGFHPISPIVWALFSSKLPIMHGLSPLVFSLFERGRARGKINWIEVHPNKLRVEGKWGLKMNSLSARKCLSEPFCILCWLDPIRVLTQSNYADCFTLVSYWP